MDACGVLDSASRHAKKINTKNYFHIQYQPGYFGAVALLGDGLLFYAPTYDLSNCNFIL